MTRPGIVVVGAGPCGIGAALTLRREFPDQPFVLVDARPVGGGNAASETTPEGFTFDYGSHVLFVHESCAEFSAVLSELDAEWTRSRPIRVVRMFGRMVPSPIQRNIHRLPRAQALPILAGLAGDRVRRKVGLAQPAATAAAEETLDEYLTASFGRALADRVMKPLNRKMWTLDPTEMSSVWVRQRSGSHQSNVPQVNLSRLLRHALRGTDDPVWAAEGEISYPASGGGGAIWTRLLDKVGADHIMLGRRVVGIDVAKRSIAFDDGSRMEYEALISSMPLDNLLRLCADRPDLHRLAGGLRRSGALLLGFGIRGTVPRRYDKVHSLQCPEKELPFWRISLPSNFSPGNVPDDGHYSVLCEVSVTPREPIGIDDGLRARVRRALMALGLLKDESAIVSSFEKVLSHGTPLPFLGRDELLREIHRALRPHGIVSRGRFGGWKYEVSNQDHAYTQGVEAVRYVLSGVPERTYPHPRQVN